ncbi:hypothetical protein GCM10025768_13220 [Microbacterium pseudoresistens]|uniref:DUF2568 domain-containing protein n=1 Tax=Microbacterium pseudoresistens TaxID=640634 RepID=A0A7Y9ESU1_9MICO|nr:DUF2568 domain-containing protein [Microbacterium pseudoresistens]NYD53323.1 hypothetical protein [Microbacterium pseudoresistens]
MSDADPFVDASPLRGIALVLRFLLELALLVAVAMFAWHLAPADWGWLTAAVAVVVVAVLWGLLLSPKARYDIRPAGRFAVELVLFAGAAAGFVVIGFGIAGVTGFAVWAIDRLVLALTR